MPPFASVIHTTAQSPYAESPYHIRAYKTANQTIGISTQNFTTVDDFAVDSDATTTNAISDFGDTTWTPPAGVYLVNIQINVNRTNNIYFLRMGLFKNGTRIILSRFEKEANADGGEIVNKSLSMSDLVFANGTDNFDVRIMGSISGTGGTNDYRVMGASAREQTFFSAYKIS
tara:strand:- start:1376 stop:1894 length:519 start_codon:yes stop_codon:yes gene_type:complete